MSRTAAVFLCTLLAAPEPGAAKWVHGRVSLEARQATVVTKFCFDFNGECKTKECSDVEKPGMMDFNLSAGRRIYTGGGGSGNSKAREVDDQVSPQLHIALLDDEYFSYPEVSQVWGEANCTDVLKASKKSIRLDWERVLKGDGEEIHVPLIEKVRPRWWYVAFVSCSEHNYEFTYSIHLVNRLQGWQSEFSMDSVGVLAVSLSLTLMFGALALAQYLSSSEWSGRGQMGKSRRTHPSLMLLSGSTALSLLGNVSWLIYYWTFMQSGESAERWAVLARLCIISAKTLMQIMLMLLAQGLCVCSPDIIWAQHGELIAGMVIFGGLSLALELWGDSQFWTSSTEFVYDTRPGCALVAFDLLWLWSFASKSYATFSRETRARPRRFYLRYGPIFGLWFAALPLLAALARAVAPWVRFRVTFAVSGLAHAVALAALVHSFRPSVAPEVYEIRAREHEVIKDVSEVDAFLGEEEMI